MRDMLLCAPSQYADAEWKLLLISHASIVGSVPQVGAEGREGGEGMKVYCIEQVAIVPLTLEGTPEVIGLHAPVGSTLGHVEGYRQWEHWYPLSLVSEQACLNTCSVCRQP